MRLILTAKMRSETFCAPTFFVPLVTQTHKLKVGDVENVKRLSYPEAFET